MHLTKQQNFCLKNVNAGISTSFLTVSPEARISFRHGSIREYSHDYFGRPHLQNLFRLNSLKGLADVMTLINQKRIPIRL